MNCETNQQIDRRSFPTNELSLCKLLILSNALGMAGLDSFTNSFE